MFNIRTSLVGLLAALFLSFMAPAQITLPDEVLPSMATCSLPEATRAVGRAVRAGFLPGCTGCELWSSSGAGTGAAAAPHGTQTFHPISAGFTITVTWHEDSHDSLFGLCISEPECIESYGCGGWMTLRVTAVPAGVQAAQFVLNIGGQTKVVTYPSHTSIEVDINLPCSTGKPMDIKLDSATVDGVPVHIVIAWMMQLWCTSCS